MRATLSLLVFFTVTALAGDWAHYGGGPAQMRYSPLTQITRENVGRLRPAWT
jgi:quinoprotein glucose dehydrogenase